MPKKKERSIDTVGLIGLGLMGQGIASCLISRGLKVVAWSRSPERESETRERIGEALELLLQRKVISRARLKGWEKRFIFVPALEDLKDCPFVIETVKEDLGLKQEIYDKLEKVIPSGTVIASNTSSIPVTLLQKGRKHPERFIAMHWGEPAEVMRYLEIIPGEQTSAATVEQAGLLGRLCGKDPSVLNFDIRGFVSNRMMYAMMREAFHLVESGVADLETVDRSFRNDIGWWATLAGPFRWMDLTGIPAYATVMEGLFPELCNADKVPSLLKEVLAKGARGITNGKGFYAYSADEAREWEMVWLEFTHDVRKLVEKYEKRVKL